MQYNEVAIGQLLTKDHGSCVYYCTMKSESDKKDIYSFSDTISKYDYDFENHIYIVTFGYELSNISYSRMSRPMVNMLSLQAYGLMWPDPTQTAVL